MGSSSDWDTLQHAVTVLLDFGVQHEVQVVSAHRVPDAMFRFAGSAACSWTRRRRSGPAPRCWTRTLTVLLAACPTCT
jgi:hypothetical protein